MRFIDGDELRVVLERKLQGESREIALRQIDKTPTCKAFIHFTQDAIKLDPCVCGGRSKQVEQWGRSGKYYCRCSCCGKESEMAETAREARQKWNDLVEKEKDEIIRGVYERNDEREDVTEKGIADLEDEILKAIDGEERS